MDSNVNTTNSSNISSNNSSTDGGNISSHHASGSTSSNFATQESLASISQTATLVVNQAPGSFTANREDIVLPLTLRGRPTVTWDETVEDNEGLGRKKSKRCCIFHKQRDFGESSTDSSDNDDDHSDSSSSSGGGFSDKKPTRRKKEKRRPIARPKQSKVPNFQRYHA